MVRVLESWLASHSSVDALSSALRANIGTQDQGDVGALAGVLRGFILGIPQALEAAHVAGRAPDAERPVAFAVGQMLHYLFDPDDLLSDKDYGALGLLDDAYLIHAVVARLLVAFPAHEPVTGAYEEPKPATWRIVRALLPEGVADALDRTSQDLVTVATLVFSPNARQRNEQSSVMQQGLRVPGAIALLAQVHSQTATPLG